MAKYNNKQIKVLFSANESDRSLFQTPGKGTLKLNLVASGVYFTSNAKRSFPERQETKNIKLKLAANIKILEFWEYY